MPLYRYIVLFFLFGGGFMSRASAQDVNVDVRPIYGNYSFNYNQVPEDLVSLSVTPVNYTFQWEYSSSPNDNAVYQSVSGGTNSNLSFSVPLIQTTYYRRRVTSGNVVLYSNVVKLELVSINWENINYVREHDVLIPGQSDWKVIDQLPIGSKLQSTTYMDGLGRPIQQVSRESATPPEAAAANTVWGDRVQFSVFDALGRQPKQYLPYTTTSNTGKYKTNNLTEQPQYYSNVYNETNAFSSLTYDNSPLNRVLNAKSPGTTWAASTGNSMAYELNDATDMVRVFTIGYNVGDVPVTTAVYPVNTLYKSRTVNEQGEESIAYTNSFGEVVLTKTPLANTPNVDNTIGICVYSIYDDFGRLRYRLQPEAVRWLSTHNWSFAGTEGQAVLDDLCFKYEYDVKGRTVLKKAPGAKELYMLYDVRDRVVFMQDGNQRAQSTPEWTANIYDELDRPVLTTLYHTTKTKVTLQTDIDNASATASAIAIAAQNATVSVYNTPITSADLNNSSINSIIKINFYDDYSYTGAKPFNTNFDNNLAYPTGTTQGEPIVNSNRTINMPTGSLTRVLGSNTFLASTVYYDEQGRIIQSTDDNIKTGTDVSTMQYGFDNRLLSMNSKHTTTSTGYTNYSVVTKNNFDKLGRVISIEKKYGSSAFKVISTYSFDDVGRLKKKHLAPGYTGTNKTEIETLAYSYNLHNEITGINKDYALKASGYNKWNNFFGMYLGYDNKDGVFARAELTGRVGGTLWSTQGDDAQRKYDFEYDKAGRLTKAMFAEKQKPADAWSAAKLNFTVTGRDGLIEYDLNGNLKFMTHYGIVAGNAAPLSIDELWYDYAGNSNKLLKVTDHGTAGTANGKQGDFKDGSNGTADDYVYDDNGNLVIDLNKDIKDLAGQTAGKGIRYNFLDKPEEIRISGKGVVKIVYDADGTKLQKIFTPEAGGAAVTTTYINDYVYKENELQYINFEEGRVRVLQAVSQNNGYDLLTIDGSMDLPNSKRGAFDYFIRDYQSNVRMVLTEEVHQGSNACTMETNRAANEEPIFGAVDAAGTPTAANEVKARFPVSDIPGQSTNNGWTNSTIGSYVIRVGNLAGNKIGPNALLKVMAGDAVTASTIYYYKNAVTNTNSGNNILSSLVTSLTQTLSGSAVADPLVKGAAGNITSQLNGNIPFSNITSPDANNSTGTNPKAYLTVLFFDERFNFVEEGSIAKRVSVAGNGAPLLSSSIQVPKNGYAYVYVSNESDEHIYFDNLQINHTRGRITEENHYYAYGLKIAGISSKKLADLNEGQVKNNYGYQGDFSEFDDDLNLNDFTLRNYDQQTGRWLQNDPYNEFPSGYIGMGDNPINNVDPDGGCIFCETAAKALSLPEVTIKAVKHVSNVSNLAKVGSFGIGVGKGLWAGLRGLGTFIANDAWQKNTWINTGNLISALAISQASNGNSLGAATAMSWLDNKTGTDFGNTYENLSNATNNFISNAPNMSAEQWGNATGQFAFAVMGTKGLGTLKNVSRISKIAVLGEEGIAVKYIGRLEDLKAIPRSQTLLDELPNLGSPKANYYQNMSVLRKALRDGYSIKDASKFRPNTELAPTLKNPTRTIGQTFLGAERNLLKNRGL